MLVCPNKFEISLGCKTTMHPLNPELPSCKLVLLLAHCSPMGNGAWPPLHSGLSHTGQSSFVVFISGFVRPSGFEAVIDQPDNSSGKTYVHEAKSVFFTVTFTLLTYSREKKKRNIERKACLTRKRAMFVVLLCICT